VTYTFAKLVTAVKELKVISIKVRLIQENPDKSSAVEMGDRFATIDMGRKVGGGLLCPFRGAGFPSNTMWSGPMPTSVPSSILIHPTVCNNTPTLQTDRTDNAPIA